MWSLAQLLSPAGHANLAALAAALPPPLLPADAHALAAGSDPRATEAGGAAATAAAAARVQVLCPGRRAWR